MKGNHFEFKFLISKCNAINLNNFMELRLIYQKINTLILDLS